MMRKQHMFLGGPGLDGYAFQADVYCVQCGYGIIMGLPDREYTDAEANDAEQVPVPIFFGDSDTAQHCARCGDYLYGPFTGVEDGDEEI